MIRFFTDTSGDFLSAVLSADSEVIASLRLFAGRKMSEMIVSKIDGLFSSAGISLSDTDEFYAVTGPGSFTGVRIGIAAVMGFAEGVSKPCYGVSSLDAAACASGLSKCSCCAPLKDDVFATRTYDFDAGLFSAYRIEEIPEEDLKRHIIVNGAGGRSVDLYGAVKSGRYGVLSVECAPLYLRKSEAEINLDKKSGVKRS